MIPYPDFAAQAAAVEARMERACAAAGRMRREVRLMAVTKNHGPWAVEYAARHGLSVVGENRVQEAAEKRPLATAPVGWELIGPLQSNKAKLAAGVFDRVQTVDRAKIAQALARARGEAGLGVLPVLLQVNAGDDPAKSGVSVADAPALLEAVLAVPGLRVEGLMTIAPLAPDPAVARRCFARLRETRDRLEALGGLRLPELSMGMSDDLESAIAEGSTCIRVGTALFGIRR